MLNILCMVYLPTLIIEISQMWVKISNLTWMIWIRPSHCCQDLSDQNSKRCFLAKNPRVRVEHQPDKESRQSRLDWFELFWWWLLSVFQEDICFWMMLKQIRLIKHFSLSFCEFAPWENKVFLVKKNQHRCMQVLLLGYCWRCWRFRNPAKQLTWNASKYGRFMKTLQVNRFARFAPSAESSFVSSKSYPLENLHIPWKYPENCW